LNKAFCLPVKIDDRAGKGLGRTVPSWGLPKGQLMLCLNFAHPLASRSATITLSHLCKSIIPHTFYLPVSHSQLSGVKIEMSIADQAFDFTGFIKPRAGKEK
jgi:hypothetical protein